MSALKRVLPPNGHHNLMESRTIAGPERLRENAGRYQQSPRVAQQRLLPGQAQNNAPATANTTTPNNLEPNVSWFPGGPAISRPFSGWHAGISAR
jgi:hypothetical protein